MTLIEDDNKGSIMHNATRVSRLLVVSTLAIVATAPLGQISPAWAQTTQAAPSSGGGETGSAPASIGQKALSPADQAAVAASVALLQAQPVALVMVRGPVPWIKTCVNPSAPEDCQAVAAFAFDALAPNSLEISVDTLAKNNTHAVTVVLPLDLQLPVGFTFGWGGTHAARGTYATCRKIGCIGTVVLDAKDYDAFKASSKAAIAFTTLAGRNVELQAPLDGMKDAIDGRAIGADELKTLSEAAVKKHNEAIADYNDKLAKEKADTTASDQTGGQAKPADPAAAGASSTEPKAP